MSQHSSVSNVGYRCILIFSCNKRIVVKINSSLSSKQYHESISFYQSALSKQHEESCPWFGLQSCEYLSDPLTESRSKLLADFERRFQKLVTLPVVFSFILLLRTLAFP